MMTMILVLLGVYCVENDLNGLGLILTLLAWYSLSKD